MKITPSPNTTPPSPNSNLKPNNPRQKSPITEPVRQGWLFHIIKSMPNHLSTNLPISANSSIQIALLQNTPYTVTTRGFPRKSVDKKSRQHTRKRHENNRRNHPAIIQKSHLYTGKIPKHHRQIHPRHPQVVANSRLITCPDCSPPSE